MTKDVTVETNIDVSKEGSYTVHYYVTDKNGVVGHSVLTVIIAD